VEEQSRIDRADHSGKLASQIAMRWKIRWLGLPVRIRARVQLQPTVLTRVYRSGTAIDTDSHTDEQPYRPVPEFNVQAQGYGPLVIGWRGPCSEDDVNLSSASSFVIHSTLLGFFVLAYLFYVTLSCIFTFLSSHTRIYRFQHRPLHIQLCRR